MKIFFSFVAIGLILISCNNTPVPTPPFPKVELDSSKYNANMVDNKKDLVCGMPVNAGINDTAHYQGKVYGFCSKECKDAFWTDPKKYAAKDK